MSRRLPPEHATLYPREWIANHQRLDAILADLYRVSAKAAHQLLRAATDDPTAPTTRRNPLVTGRSAEPNKKNPGYHDSPGVYDSFSGCYTL